MHKLTLILFVLLLSAQNASAQFEMADVMRSNGKIYVVVAVAAIVLLGLIAYVISVDMKVRKLEKEVSEKNRK